MSFVLRRFRDQKSCQTNRNNSWPTVVSKKNWNAVTPPLCWFIEPQEMGGILPGSMLFATIKDQLLPWWRVEITFLEATQSSRGMVSINYLDRSPWVVPTKSKSRKSLLTDKKRTILKLIKATKEFVFQVWQRSGSSAMKAKTFAKKWSIMSRVPCWSFSFLVSFIVVVALWGRCVTTERNLRRFRGYSWFHCYVYTRIFRHDSTVMIRPVMIRH